MVPNEQETKSSKVKFYSIKTGTFIHEFKFHTQIFSISCNRNILLVVRHEKKKINFSNLRLCWIKFMVLIQKL